MRRLFRAATAAAAALFFIEIAVGITGVPGCLKTGDRSKLNAAPRYIVVLGGGGIPSESGLIRTYYAAKVGAGLTGATFIVSLPCVGDPSTNSVGRMRDELALRGINRASIVMEHEALNTHEQAVNISRMLGPAALREPTLVVTSPYHLRRALLCFEKEGFTRIAGVSAFGIGAEADVSAAGPEGLRYTFWANLHEEVDDVREYFALAYYKVKGWI